ncbi:hypothetical protein VL15_07300 [Burkholderia cepacia]|uniref:Uncharacterized protein n=1 Tax=Burkholderia cepacia TaxID=292 RepID=A0A0J5XAH0_BURCE|nr:hypothetical protein VL15_07300 [Burkholderia cepacia]
MLILIRLGMRVHSKNIDYNQGVGGIGIEIDSTSLSLRVRLQIPAKRRAIRSEPVIVQSCLSVEPMTGPTKVIFQGALIRHANRPIRIDLLCSPDLLTLLILDPLRQASLIMKYEIGSPCVSRCVCIIIIDEHERE